MASDAQKRALEKYKAKVKRFTVDFPPTDAELWEHLNKQPNKQGYIKALIRADMERGGENASGQWIGEGDGYADGEIVLDVWYCSECNYCIDDGTDDPEALPNYCPCCGAKMEGGKAND